MGVIYWNTKHCSPWISLETFFLNGFQKLHSMMASKDVVKKSCIRETKHLSTDADSSTDTRVGWTKTTQKPVFFFVNAKNHIKRKKIKNF